MQSQPVGCYIEVLPYRRRSDLASSNSCCCVSHDLLLGDTGADCTMSAASFEKLGCNPELLERVAGSDYFRPERFWAMTKPLGVGINTAEISPSCSILRAASRTVLRWELASCIRMSPLGFICGRKRRTSFSRKGGSLSLKSRSILP